MTSIVHWNLDPEIVNLFGTISLRYYGILFTTGLLLAFFTVKYLFEKEGYSPKHLDALGLYILIGTVFGARLGHCLFYDPVYYLSNPFEMILPFKWDSDTGFMFTGYLGLASHGGAIGVLIATYIFTKKYDYKFLWLFDRIAIAFPIAAVFIRFGNFFNSEILGKPTNGDYGVVFAQIDLIPRHPAQLYEASAYLLIFVVLMFLFSNIRKRSNGFYFGISIALLSSARFLIEFFKENQVAFESGLFLNMGQFLSIPFILVGVALALKNRAEKEDKVEESEMS